LTFLSYVALKHLTSKYCTPAIASFIALTVTVVLCVFPVHLSFAEELPTSTDALLLQIAGSDYWHKLIHYRYSWWSHHFQSDIDDPKFFFAENGREDPFAELSASITTFRADASSICRFPARFYWLANTYGQQLGLSPAGLDNCQEFQTWLHDINPGSAALIFPAAYLNGPSSMFGHTLLRIDPADERKNVPLIAYAVNYAANVHKTDNDMAFALKGIFGGYPGMMSIVPYHQKINEYGDIENRDIWEYQLNLNHQELLQLMRHTWELKDLRPAYYFFTVNCSYLILNLLDVAREDIHLTNEFDVKVIPVDTVRQVVKQDLVASTNYRPSAATVLLQHYKILTPDQQQKVKYLSDLQPALNNDTLISSNDSEQARILELTFDTLRYRANQNPSQRDKNAAYNLNLLKTRSKLEVKNPWPEIVAPATRPEQGHKSARFAMGFRNRHITASDSEQEHALVMQIRPAYHDLLDPGEGFPFGAQINFLDVSASYDTVNHDARLENVTFIDILSLTPNQDLFDEFSWRVNFGYDHLHLVHQSVDILKVTPGFGKSYQWNRLLGYALINTPLEYSGKLQDNHALGAGLQVGVLLSNPHYAAQLGCNTDRMFSGETETRYAAELSFAWHINNSLSFRLTAQREKRLMQTSTSQLLNLNWYF